MMGIRKMLYENSEKRKEFCRELKEVNFDFDSRKVTLKEFKEKVEDMSRKLEDLCKKNLQNVNGSETYKQLLNICNHARKVKESIINNNIQSGKALASTEVDELNGNFRHLKIAFENANDAHYRFLIKRSRLDHKDTRKYFLNLAQQVQKCRAIYFALVSEFNFSCLKNELDTTDTGLIIEKDYKPPRLKNELYFVTFDNGCRRIFYQKVRSIDLFVINDMLGIFQHLAKIRDFSEQITYLKKVKRKLTAVEEEKRSCDICGRSSNKSDFVVESCLGKRHHTMCIDCLQEAISDNNFKCPKCGSPIEKTRAMLRMKGHLNN